MPGNSEEKKRCQEKLVQMERFLPFLDFMIDKIKKKSSEISLECQLSKFQNLKSMIVEKNAKYTWEAIVKVEEVIQKLIEKLDYDVSDSVESKKSKNSMAASVSVISSSTTTTISVTNASSLSCVTTVDSRPQDSPVNTVDLIIKELKMSIDKRLINNTKNEKEKETNQSTVTIKETSENSHNTEVSNKVMETDLDKDLDGFELTDGLTLSGADSKNTVLEPSTEGSEKVSSHVDLLSSSREKLLKSLQKKLKPIKNDRVSIISSTESVTEKTSDSQDISAYNYSKVRDSVSESRNKSEFINVETVFEANGGSDKPNNNTSSVDVLGLTPLLSPKSFYSESSAKESKTLSDFGCNLNDLHSKQKLREKLCADICEVYRVPGKSVGGSLRSLKDAKDNKKSVAYIEEEELFKPDKIIEVHRNLNEKQEKPQTEKEKFQGNSSCSKTDSKEDLNNKDKGYKKNGCSHSKESLQSDKRRDDKTFKRCSKEREKFESRKDVQERGIGYSKDDKKSYNSLNKEEKKTKPSELDSFNDEELLEVLKENVKTLPHLSKLKPSDLRKVHSSLFEKSATQEGDTGSLHNEVNFRDLDNFMNDPNVVAETKMKSKANIDGKKVSKCCESENETSVFRKEKDLDRNDRVNFLTTVTSEKEKQLECVRDINAEDKNIQNLESLDNSFLKTSHKTVDLKPKKNLLDLQMPKADEFNSVNKETFRTKTVVDRDPRKKKGTINRQSTEAKNNVSQPEMANRPQYNSAVPLDTISNLKFQGPSHCAVQNTFRTNCTEMISMNHLPEKDYADSLLESRYCNSLTNFPMPINPNMQNDFNQIPSYNSYLLETSDIKQRYLPHPYINNIANSNQRYNQCIDRRIEQQLSRPKSYADYKRMKFQEQQKFSNNEPQLREKSKNISVGVKSMSNIPFSYTALEKKFVKTGFHLNNSQVNKFHSIRKSKKNKSKRKKMILSNLVNQKEKSSNDVKLKTENPKVQKIISNDISKDVDDVKKKTSERRQSLESEELVSPLESLYQSENMPKTGRGYGLQNFKIPKKIREIDRESKLKENKSKEHLPQELEKINKVNKSKANSVELSKNSEKSEIVNDSIKNSLTKPKNGEKNSSINQTDCNNSVIYSQKIDENSVDKMAANDKLDFNSTCEKKTETAENVTKDSFNDLAIGKIKELNEFDFKSTNNNKEEKVETNETNLNTQECGFNIHKNDKDFQKEITGSSVSGNKTVSKEEITQEFVEALIRKSFQFGEGKLLLAQAKLFEEFTRKLNSKKLKTIQKIINSESDSSSSSTESSSDEEGRKKKNKKLEKKVCKSKKKKKKVQKYKKIISSSSESNESDEGEVKGTKENKFLSVKEKQETHEADRLSEVTESNKNIKTDRLNYNVQESVSFNEKSSQIKNQASDIKKCISRKKKRRKQGQKNLLEQMLNEVPKADSGLENNNCGEAGEKEFEVKVKSKPKGKVKTELDRLHDDIRNMFICSGVVTATGQRMCRILKESGGSMNNLDIVKESAKMVEEEKLKNVELHRYPRKYRVNNNGDDDKCKNLSAEKLVAQDQGKPHENTVVGESTKEQKNMIKMPIPPLSAMRKTPCVVLHKLDLSKFKYGQKVSENRVVFRHIPGRNVGVRHKRNNEKLICESPKWGIDEKKLEKNVFLARNLRKIKRNCKNSNKKGYTGKKLVDVIKNLPLKMAKMKHLEIREKNLNKMNTSHKKISQKKIKTNDKQKKCNKIYNDLSPSKLLHYAFNKKKVVYPCKLCLRVTKNITFHYKTDHPESDVLISRLGKAEAQRAIEDSKENNYDTTSLEQACSLEIIKRRVQSKLKEPLAYYCRMCACSKITDINAFFTHVSSHTGEYRFKCPNNECDVTMPTKENLKFHILLRHPNNKYDLNDKMIEVLSVPLEGGNLYGYLCSKCNYVQILLKALELHVNKYHSLDDDVSIIKIDMSAKPSKEQEKYSTVKKIKNLKLIDGDDKSSDAEENSESGNRISKHENLKELKKGNDGENSEEKEKIIEKPSKKVSVLEETENISSSNMVFQENKDDSCDKMEIVEIEEASNDENLLPQKTYCSSTNKNLVVSDHSKSFEQDYEETLKSKSVISVSCGESKMKEITDSLNKNMEESKKNFINDKFSIGNDATSAVQKSTDEKNDCQITKDFMANTSVNSKVPIVKKLKIGPLEAQIVGNSVVLYECYVKGCLFSTKVFDLFEKHVKISHAKIKWDGLCEICQNQSEPMVVVTSCKLIYALNHLRYHERNKNYENIKLDTESPLDGGNINSENFGNVINDFEEQKIESQRPTRESEKREYVLESETESTLYPRVPLLRVRNLVGDRLSTPKDLKENSNESQFDLNSEGLISGNSGGAEKNDVPAMFTIENVRSLNPKNNAEDANLQVDDLVPFTVDNESPHDNKGGSAKPVIVRSCPTRKITIRPDSKTYPVEVGNLQVVKTPLVFTSVPNTPPFRVLSSLSSPQSSSMFKVQPVVISTSPTFTQTSQVSVLPASLTTSSSSANLAVSSNPEGTDALQKSLVEKIPREQQINLAESSHSVHAKANKSPAKRVRTKVYRSNYEGLAPLSELEEMDEAKQKSLNTIQKLSNPTLGNKSVKDAKIYQEMLTKTKLCHLYKCMAIECSFTCNDEGVFTQHIGLHEAQRRMKNQNAGKNSAESGNKSRRIYNWHQCAYCCEVLANSSYALSLHITVEHGHCIYQCAYCFYRAISQSYVEIHQNLAHAQILKSHSRVIYKCKPLSVPPPLASVLEKQGKRQSVRPYHCDQCGSKFFITQEFLNHLITEHQSVTAYTCHICKNLCFKADRLIVHYKLHSYCTHQCAYCLHGTETEKEMMCHLSNFHFSQPAYIYVRAMADNQKSSGSQLDSLKVIVYDSDIANSECIVDADDPDEEISDDASKNLESLDLSAIVAELGINTENTSSTDVTPLIKELASISSKTSNNFSVTSLLPNAQFSSENESSAENCFVLVSSGVNSSKEQSEEKDMSVPLGQLNLEVVSVNNRQNAPPKSPPHKNIMTSNKNLKLNEIIINLHKEKPYVPATSGEATDKAKDENVIGAAFHKMPPVVLSRKSSPKNVYFSKNTSLLSKKSDNFSQESVSSGVLQTKIPQSNVPPTSNIATSSINSTTDHFAISEIASGTIETEKQAFISNIHPEVFTKTNFEGSNTSESLFKITEVCSLSADTKASSQDGVESQETLKAVIRRQSKDEVLTPLKPPIIRVEDFVLDEEKNINLRKNESKSKIEIKATESKTMESKNEESLEELMESPEVIFIEEKDQNQVLTVTIDSDDEKDVDFTKKCSSDVKSKISGTTVDNVIRKEMEKLRNQIADETDCLLFDDALTDPTLSKNTLIDVKTPDKSCKPEGLLSPIEEAICSLNKKLEEEGEKQRKENAKEEDKKQDEIRKLPRTRSFTKEKAKREEKEVIDKNNDDGSVVCSNIGVDENKKEDKKFKEELIGKELYICGNEKCNFAAEGDTELKDHLYVCDLSRESSTLTCPHCLKQIKLFNTYIEHLKHHGEKKYSCGLCPFKSAVENSVTRHVKAKHKCGQLKSVPTDPPKEGYLIYYPKNYKLDKQDFEISGYSPGDEDKLPLQAVYQVNVKCAKCPYFTKVRSNMVRHLKIHVKSAETEGVVVVPSTAPTNPVPCLDTKERMFDKMTNLAASSQLAQAKEKTAIEALAPEEEAKLPQFITEQLRYKCCLPDCNYITVDDSMLKHHIKALHDEINYYSCPHCKDTVHVDVRHVTLEKIGYHLKLHDSKLYKCAHCIYFHYQKAVVEKHTLEKHPDKRYYVHTVREPKGIKGESLPTEEVPSVETSKVWKCGLCSEFQSQSRVFVMEHLGKVHSTKSKYKCQLCDMKSNHYHAFFGHFASKHLGEKVSYIRTIEQVNSSGDVTPSSLESSSEHFDTTPLWQRGAPRVRHIRGILIEEEEVKAKKSKKISDESEVETEKTDVIALGNAFYCPLCSDKKTFYTRNPECFRSHLYQELNYQQFACILCGKMFVDKKDYEKHHAKVHPDKPQSLKQTKEDGEIMFWVDKVIARQMEKMESRKRRLSEDDSNDCQTSQRKKKKFD